MKPATSITIITALGPRRDTFLRDAAASVAAAAKNAPFPVAWIIVGGHGAPAQLPSIAASTPGVELHYEVLDSPSPACIGRNHAACLAPDDTILVNLDSDDMLSASRLSIICEDTIAQVTLAQDLVETPDGWVASSGPATRTGLRPAPWFGDAMQTYKSHLDIHMATLAIRREVLLSAGGYPALPWVEDSVLAFRLSEARYDLEVADTVGYVYRKHAAQTTAKGYNPQDLLKPWTTPQFPRLHQLS